MKLCLDEDKSMRSWFFTDEIIFRTINFVHLKFVGEGPVGSLWPGVQEGGGGQSQSCLPRPSL